MPKNIIEERSKRYAALIQASRYMEIYMRDGAAAGALCGIGIFFPYAFLLALPFAIDGAIKAYQCQVNLKMANDA